MQNHGSFRLLDNFNEEDRFYNDGLVSVVENDYVLNYINDPDPVNIRFSIQLHSDY